MGIAAGALATLFGSAANAATVEEAAKKLADTSYPMVKATDWATTDVLDKYMATVPTTKEFSKAILELSVNLDPKLVKDAVLTPSSRTRPSWRRPPRFCPSRREEDRWNSRSAG